MAGKVEKEVDAEVAEHEYIVKRIDPNRAEAYEYSKHLRTKVIDESVEGVIPDVSDPEDATGRQTGPRMEKKSAEVTDLMDSGHGFAVTTRPGEQRSNRKCLNCGGPLLFGSKPCKAGLWVGDAMRLSCRCDPCKKLTSMLVKESIPLSNRKYCGRECQTAAARKRKHTDSGPVVSKPVRYVEDVHPELFDMIYRGLKERANRAGKPGPTDWDVLEVCELARRQGIDVSEMR